MTGFSGDNDLYGLGIRIGYYTAALSIWIGNLWAPCEIYFLRHVTIVFLVAILVGVSVLSINPSTTYAIVPFMLMHVSYCTYYMGLLIPPSPEYLEWEKEYFSFFVTAVVGLMLHSYDTWYWWIGQAKMLPTPGTPTLGFFVYFGQQDIYGWIRYVVKVYLAWFLFFMFKELIKHRYFHHLEKKMDAQVPPARLKVLCEHWRSVLESATRNDLIKEGTVQSPPLLSPPVHSRKASANSLKSLANSNPLSTTSRTEGGTVYAERASPSFDDSKKDDFGEKRLEDLDDKISAPEPGIKRTMSEKLRYHLLGWKSEDYNLGDTPVYTYHPSLESIDTACTLLRDINQCKASRFKTYFALWDCLFAFFIRLPISYITHGYRPRVVLAIEAHLDALMWKRRASKSEMYRRALMNPAYKTLSPEDISLASRILLTTEPIGEPNRRHILSMAWALFGSCSLLVIGTELTIQWNYITGVQTLTTVGQLIPAAVGIGGFLRVVYSALFEKGEEMDCLNRCKVMPKRNAWKEAGAAYQQAEQALERRRDLKGKEKEKEIA